MCICLVFTIDKLQLTIDKLQLTIDDFIKTVDVRHADVRFMTRPIAI